MKWTRAVLPLATAGALLYIDSQFALQIARPEVLAQATVLELAIFGLQLGKTLVAFAVKRLREASLGVLLDYYGAELLILPFPALYYFLTHDPSALAVLDQMIIGWMIGAAFSTLPFVAYRVGTTMMRSGDILAALPTGTIAAEVGLLFLGAEVSTAKGGLGGLLNAVFRGNGAVVRPGQSPIFIAITVVFACMLLYALLDRGEKAGRVANRAIAIGILATLACSGWIIGISSVSPSLPLILVTPTLCIAGLSWWMGRAG